MTQARDHPEMTLPAGQFFWGVLDASLIDRTLPARRDRQLGFLFEDVLPIPIDQVHAVYRRLPGGRAYVACGMPCERLADLLGTDPTVATLVPDSLPPPVLDALEGSPPDPGSFNLRAGQFESAAVRRARRRWLGLCALLTITFGAILIVGIERRADRLAHAAARTARADLQLCEKILGPGRSASAQPLRLQVTAERRRLEQTRRDLSPGQPAADVTMLLASLLQSWPDDLHAETEVVTVSPDAISVRVILPSSDEAQRLADAVDRIEGWAIDPPQVNNTATAVRATVRLRPIVAQAGAS